VQGTPGAELFPALDPARVGAVVDTGVGTDEPGYSGFEHSDLEQVLRDRDVDAVTIVGLATDYCVRATALDALRLGFAVTVDSSAVRAVDVEAGDGERALAEVASAGATVV
jgi:nicotinamidase/pyrazinamidase